MKRPHIMLAVATAVSAATLTLTGFTPGPGPGPGQPAPAKAVTTSPGQATDQAQARRDPNDPAAQPGFLKQQQRAMPRKTCTRPTPEQRKKALQRKGPAHWCFEPIDPATAPKAPAPSKSKRNAADPNPPKQLCSKKLGQTNYDRFHACYESVGLIKNEDTNAIGARVHFYVWATLSPTNHTWLMQTGVTATDMSTDLFQAAPHFVAGVSAEPLRQARSRQEENLPRHLHLLRAADLDPRQ